MTLRDEIGSELSYYKRLLDELAAQRIALEHHQWQLHVQLRQKRQGFQLLSKLVQSLGVHTDMPSMFRVTVLALNSALEMDRTAIFVPANDGWTARYTAGLTEAAISSLSSRVFHFPPELTSGAGLLVGRESDETPVVRELRETFELETFACVPIAGPKTPLGILFAGRISGAPTLVRPLDHGDVDTLRSVSGLLQAVAQNTHLTLLEQAGRLKSEFYSNVAHEFRTPLTLTLGPLAQLLSGKWGQLPEAMREQLLVVERNQERILLLINEILDLARLEEGAAELRLARIDDVNLFVSDCVSHFRGAAEARDLAVRLALDAKLANRPLLADREKLERVLVNLISNALKFTDKGSIEIGTALEEGELRLIVEDSGVGIAEADLPHVFDRFRRGQAAGARSGSGIGLALVKQMTELHQGRVMVASRRGHGTRFDVVIPFRSAVEVSGSEQEPSASPHRRRTARRGCLSPAESNREQERRFVPEKSVVLYVEDDAEMRDYVKSSLEGDFNVFVAEDGAEGLSAAERYRPDVIITDQRMPVMEGRELLVALRADPDLRSIPVVFLTAQYGTEGRIETLVSGADDYLGKPFHEAELRARISNLVRIRRHEQQLIELNRRLQMQVREQMTELVKAGELESYLPRAVLDRLRRGPSGEHPPPVRRVITVLVAELGALDVFAERVDESAIAPIVNAQLAAISAIVTAHGGVVDAMTGGRLSILFGATETADSQRSAWAALEVASAVRALADQASADARRRGLAHRARCAMGIATSPCIVGAFGADLLRTFTAIGPAMRLAAELQCAADTNEIVCDDATRELLRDRVRVRSGRSHHIIEFVASEDQLMEAAIAPPASVSSGAEPPGTDRVFLREGDYWTIAYGGRVVRLASAKGMHYLARLLREPRVELHVSELVTAERRLDPTTPSLSKSEASRLGLNTGDPGGALPALDARAKAAYRQRLSDLEDERVEAALLGDAPRAERVEHERAAIARELAAGLGLGGRDRKASASVERTRVNVTRAIRAVIHKLRTECPELGRHLQISIRTGTFCSYVPPFGVPDSWNVSD